jgi:hypothetical protein
MSRAKEREKGIPFVMIPSEWFWGKSPDFLALSVRARMVYFCLRSNCFPRTKSYAGNNGQVDVSYSAFQKGSGFSSDTTISKALKELEGKGWIERTEKGGLFGKPNNYRLTGKYDPFVSRSAASV